MTTRTKKLLMMYIKMNLHVNRNHVRDRIEYVDKNVNTEPGRAIDTYYGRI